MNNRKSSNVKTKNDDAPPTRGVRLAEDADLTTIKISNKSTTKGVAGAIAHLARDNRAVDVLAGSASALNVAVKATAVARVYLNADAPDCGLAASMSMNDGRKTVSLKLVIFDAKHIDDETPDNATLTVASKTDSGALAGAIAARVREGKPVKLSAVGAGSVLRAVTSVALATRYVSENFPNGLAILPTFEKTGGEDPSAGASISILKLIVKPIA